MRPYSLLPLFLPANRGSATSHAELNLMLAPATAEMVGYRVVKYTLLVVLREVARRGSATPHMTLNSDLRPLLAEMVGYRAMKYPVPYFFLAAMRGSATPHVTLNLMLRPLPAGMGRYFVAMYTLLMTLPMSVLFLMAARGLLKGDRGRVFPGRPGIAARAPLDSYLDTSLATTLYCKLPCLTSCRICLPSLPSRLLPPLLPWSTGLPEVYQESISLLYYTEYARLPKFCICEDGESWDEFASTNTSYHEARPEVGAPRGAGRRDHRANRQHDVPRHEARRCCNRTAPASNARGLSDDWDEGPLPEAAAGPGEEGHEGPRGAAPPPHAFWGLGGRDHVMLRCGIAGKR